MASRFPSSLPSPKARPVPRHRFCLPSTNSDHRTEATDVSQDVRPLRAQINELEGTDRSSTGTSNEAHQLRLRLKEREAECEARSKELDRLTKKFHDIQAGLAQIEAERQFLIKSKAKLLDEKSKIQRELDVRVSEVAALSKRYSSQEEKMREAMRAMASQSELHCELESLKTRLEASKKSLAKVEKLERELKECQDAKRELEDRLTKLKKDHDDIAETLQSCFQNMQKMTDSHQAREMDRRRDLQRAELALEQQRIEHLAEMTELKFELESRQERVHQMEQVLKENMASCAALRRDKSKLQNEKEAALAERQVEQNKAIDSIREQHCAMLLEMRRKHEEALEEKDSTIAEREGTIRNLEDELAMGMERHMSLSTELTDLYERSRQQSFTQQDEEISRRREVEALSDEKQKLEEKLEEKEIANHVLSEQVSRLEAAQHDAQSATMKLQARVLELEQENAFIMDLEEQLQEVNKVTFESQERQSLVEEEHQRTLKTMRRDFDDERNMWSTMETGLLEKIAQLETEKELLAVEVEANSEQIRILSLDQETEQTHLETIRVLEKALAVETESGSKKEANISLLTAQVEKLETQVGHIETSKEELEQTALALKERVRSMAKSREAAAHRVEEIDGEARSILEFIEHEQKESSKKEVRISSLSEQLLTAETNEAALVDKIDAMEVRVQNLSAQRDAWAKQAEEINLSSSNEVQSLRDHLDLELEFSGQKSHEISELKDHLSAVQTKRDKMAAEIQQIKTDRNFLSQQLSEMVVSADSMKGRLAVAQESTLEKDECISNLETKIEHLEASLNDLKAERDSLCRELELSKKGCLQKDKLVTNLGTKIEQLESLLNEGRTQRDKLSVDLASSNESALRTSLQKDTVTSELQAKIYDLEETVSERTAAAETLSLELASSKARAQKASSLQDEVLRRLKANIGDLEQALDERTAEREKLAGELIRSKAKLVRELKTMDKTLEGKASEVEQLDLKLQAECARSKQLEFEIGQLRSDIEQSSLATTNIQQESESALQLMRQDLADARDGYKKAESIISDLKVELAATRDEALASRSLVDENGAKISEMESALQDAKVAADTLKVDLSRAQSDLAATKEHHTSSTQELRDSLAVQEELISSLNSKLCDANIRAEHAEDTKLESDQRNANTIERLRESLQSQRKLQQEQDVAQRSALAEKDMSITHIQKQHDLQAGQHKLEISSIRHELDEKTHTIASLRKELETCREHIVSQETKRMELQEKSVLLESTKKELIEKHQREMALLTAKLQKTETDLAMANDDIRDLRLFDLKEAEETISALNAEIRALNQRGDSTKLQVSEALADKEAQLSSLRSRVSGLERSATLQDQIVARKQCEILSLQSEKASLAGELKEKYAKLQERHTCIANLTVRNAELEERERESVSRLQAMAAEQSKMQTTHEKELQTMKCVIQKHLTNHEDDETEHQQKQARLAREVAETEAKAEKAREKVDELETILEGRTQLLSDMVAHNKQTEDDKTRALGELKELKGLLERLTREKSEMEVEKAELTSEFRRKEDQFLETVQDERQLREIAESNLEDANSRLSRTSRDDKEVRELEKENALLKDKVRRQEAHLQRKLEKDKVLRERSTNRVVALPQYRSTKKATSGQKKSSSSSRRAPLRDNNGGSSVRPSGVPRVPSLIQPRSSESTRSINSHALSPMSADLEEVLGHRKTY